MPTQVLVTPHDRFPMHSPKSMPSGVTDPPSLAESEAFAAAWEAVQGRLWDLPGESGASQRAAEYAPFFLRFGRRVFIAPGCRFYHPQRIVLEDDVRFNELALVYGSGGVRFGRHARIGPRLFLHSANHEVGVSPLAFHERGYDYAQVLIGDNSLLSANVSILPGTRLGPGTFVGAGAVVTGRAYRDGVRLLGVPSREIQLSAFGGADPSGAAPREAPTVLVVGLPGDRRLEAMRRIVGTLGLAQVAVRAATPGWSVEPSVRAVLRLDDSIRVPAEDVDLWTLAGGIGATGERVALELETGERFVVPLTRTLTVVPAAGGGDGLAQAANLTLYHALKRMRKRRAQPADQLDALVGLVLAHRLPATPGLEAVRTKMSSLWSLGSVDDPALAAAIRSLAETGSLEPLADAILARANASDAVRAKYLPKRQLDVPEKVLVACPELLVAAACIGDRDRPDVRATLSRAEAILESAERAWAIVCVAATAAITGRHELVARAIRRLAEPGFLDEAAGCVRTIAKAGSGYSYSSGLAVLLVHGALQSDDRFQVQFGRELATPLSLALVTDRAVGPVVVAEKGALVCTSTRRMAASLIDLWIEALRAPGVGAAEQIELTDEMYAPLAPAIERAIRATFRSIIHAAGEPFVEVLPWPAGKRAAVSLRYDIDRAVQPGQVRKIVALQRQWFGGPCASWYAIPGTEFGSRIEGVLTQHLQEIGVHGVRADHPEAAGGGVTMHSAPKSEYWRGRSTLLGHSSAGASYSELLTCSLDRAQPFWSDDGTVSQMWVTPLHFPLEGSTNDVDLSYFDRLRSHFQGRLERGGHAIVASHPDLNQDLLRQLAAREAFDDCWCAPVGEVVERCRRLLAPGNVEVVSAAVGGPLLLRSRYTVADVAVRIEPRDQPPSVVCVQLMEGQPRPIVESTASAIG